VRAKTNRQPLHDQRRQLWKTRVQVVLAEAYRSIFARAVRVKPAKCTFPVNRPKNAIAPDREAQKNWLLHELLHDVRPVDGEVLLDATFAHRVAPHVGGQRALLPWPLRQDLGELFADAVADVDDHLAFENLQELDKLQRVTVDTHRQCQSTSLLLLADTSLPFAYRLGQGCATRGPGADALWPVASQASKKLIANLLLGSQRFV